MRCRKCGEGWSFSEEFSPIGLRFRHVCPRCGSVSERPQWGWLVWLSLSFTAISNTDSWALRGALTLVVFAVSQLAFELEKLRAPTATK